MPKYYHSPEHVKRMQDIMGDLIGSHGGYPPYIIKETVGSTGFTKTCDRIRLATTGRVR
jgi:hypothetical protein